jgi:uncharacterized protein
LAADYVGWAEGRWLRVLLLDVPHNVRESLRQFYGKFEKSQRVFSLSAAHKAEPTIAGCLQGDPLVLRHQSLLGVVAPDTDIARLRFEILRTDLDLEGGQLVEVRLGKRMVLYQIVNGLTKEAILQQKNMYGFVRGDAKKIGC